MTLKQRIREELDEGFCYYYGYFFPKSKENPKHKAPNNFPETYKEFLDDLVVQIIKAVKSEMPEEEKILYTDSIGIDGFKKGWNFYRQGLLKKLEE